MNFFFPDSLDTVDPMYDFRAEEHSPHRVRHRTDVFAHEYLVSPPYDGILLSKALVDAHGGHHRYHKAQRHRLLRNGVHRFFRLDDRNLSAMGDCGAYAYINDEQPPFPVEEVLEFYFHCGFDYTLSVDHVIPGLLRTDASRKLTVPQKWVHRRELTFHLAEEFLQKHRDYRLRSVPIGCVQGWDPVSYAESAQALEKMGYDYIALGGLASLQTEDIMACVEAVTSVISPRTRVHLLGVSRTDQFDQLLRWKVASFDSTMPLRQAFMDDKNNYHTASSAYLAMRVPPSKGNARLSGMVRRGVCSTHEIVSAEQDAMHAIQHFETGGTDAEALIHAVYDYEQLYNGRDHRSQYQRLLSDRPWETCSCAACKELGIQIAVFRGRERNKRRGYHNLFVFANKLRRALENPDVLNALSSTDPTMCNE
mgnify:CR=1 FL=1